MTMIPDQIMDAIHFAEFVMAKEKRDRIGSDADKVIWEVLGNRLFYATTYGKE